MHTYAEKFIIRGPKKASGTHFVHLCSNESSVCKYVCAVKKFTRVVPISAVVDSSSLTFYVEGNFRIANSYICDDILEIIFAYDLQTELQISSCIGLLVY